MIKEVWLNLPVKNVNKALEFYTQIGFKKNEKFQNTDEMASILIGKNSFVVMLYSTKMFKQINQMEIPDTTQFSEMLISFNTENKTDIDTLYGAAEKAGAKLSGKPTEVEGWMYGFAFSDLDGHHWNVLHMNN